MADRPPTQAEFDDACHQLKMDLLRLLGAVEHGLPHGKPFDPGPEATILEADWRGINSQIDSVLHGHDKLAAILGFYPRHERFLRGG